MKVKIRAWCIVKFEKIFSYERSFINEKQKIVESCGRKIAMGRIFLNKTERKTILFGHSFFPSRIRTMRIILALVGGMRIIHTCFGAYFKAVAKGIQRNYVE